MLEHCSKVKILLTSRKPLRLLAYHMEHCYNLNAISRESTVTLLFMKANRMISDEEVEELLDCPIPENKFAQYNQIGFNGHLYNKDRPKLISHPFIDMLGGHPQAISLTAPLLKDTMLKDLFLRF
jgi:hypothetical protein